MRLRPHLGQRPASPTPHSRRETRARSGPSGWWLPPCPGPRAAGRCRRSWVRPPVRALRLHVAVEGRGPADGVGTVWSARRAAPMPHAWPRSGLGLGLAAGQAAHLLGPRPSGREPVFSPGRWGSLQRDGLRDAGGWGPGTGRRGHVARAGPGWGAPGLSQVRPGGLSRHVPDLLPGVRG